MIIKPLLVASLLGASTLAAQGRISGWYTETHVTSRAEGERAAAAPSPRDGTIRTWRTSAAERVEGGLPAFPRYDMTGAYQISRRSEKRSYQVIPSARLIRVLHLASLTELKLDTPSVYAPGLKELGDGGVILGHRTRKYQMSVTMRMPGIARKGDSTVFTTEQTLWVANDPADPLVAAYLAERPKSSSPIKLPVVPGMVLRSESRSHGPRQNTTVRTREVVAWRREVIDPSRFALPADYKRVDMADEVRTSRAHSESLSIAGKEMSRLRASTDPKDRARAKQLAESLFADLKRTMPPPASLRDDPKAVVIDGAGKKKP